MHAGTWRFVVFEGDTDSYDTERGIRNFAGWIFMDGACGVHEFDVGVEAFQGSVTDFSPCGIAKIKTNGIQADGDVRHAFTGATANGCGARYILAQNGAVVQAFDTIVNGCTGANWCVEVISGAFCSLERADINYDAAGTTCIRCTSLGNVLRTSSTITGFVTAVSTATQGRVEPP